MRRWSILGTGVTLVAAGSVAGCGEPIDSATSSDSALTSVAATVSVERSATSLLTSPDGRFVVYRRPAANGQSEIVSVDFDAAKPSASVVDTVPANAQLSASPGGKYFVVELPRAFVHVSSWDRSLQKKFGPLGDEVTIAPDDSWIVGRKESWTTSADYNSEFHLEAHAIQLAGPGDVQGRFDERQGSPSHWGSVDEVFFAPSGSEVLFRRSDKLTRMKLSDGTIDSAFSGLGAGQVFPNTYDGTSIVVATESYEAHEHSLVRKSAASATTLTPASALFRTGSRYVKGLSTGFHCLVPVGTSIYFFNTPQPGKSRPGLAKWDPKGGYELLHAELPADPGWDQQKPCSATLTADGDNLVYIGSDGNYSYPSTHAGMTSVSTKQNGPSTFVPLGRQLDVAAKATFWPSGFGMIYWSKEKEIRFVDLHGAGIVATTTNAGSGFDASAIDLPNGSFLWISNDGGLFETSKGVTKRLHDAERSAKLWRFGTKRVLLREPERLTLFKL